MDDFLIASVVFSKHVRDGCLRMVSVAITNKEVRLDER
jgi:hypothetical protein